MTTQQAIELLRQQYVQDKFHFDFRVSMLIAGDSKKKLRQDIIKELTGEVRPLTKCGMYAAADILKASFEQFKLFSHEEG
jgi:hypothetical protein